MCDLGRAKCRGERDVIERFRERREVAAEPRRPQPRRPHEALRIPRALVDGPSRDQMFELALARVGLRVDGFEALARGDGRLVGVDRRGRRFVVVDVAYGAARGEPRRFVDVYGAARGERRFVDGAARRLVSAPQRWGMAA